jgi:uncharacterized membrane protein
VNTNNNGYWKANLRLLGILLSIWFTVSFGFGILLVEELNQIAFFIHLMQKLDRQYGVSDDEDESSNQEDA